MLIFCEFLKNNELVAIYPFDKLRVTCYRHNASSVNCVDTLSKNTPTRGVPVREGIAL